MSAERDELDRLAEALRERRPEPVRRARGMQAAMAAFDAEFDGAAKESAPASQGSDAARRLTGRSAPAGRAGRRRDDMSTAATRRLPTRRMWGSGTAIAAALAAFVVVPQMMEEGRLNDAFAPVPSASQDREVAELDDSLVALEPQAEARSPRLPPVELSPETASEDAERRVARAQDSVREAEAAARARIPSPDIPPAPQVAIPPSPVDSVVTGRAAPEAAEMQVESFAPALDLTPAPPPPPPPVVVAREAAPVPTAPARAKVGGEGGLTSFAGGGAAFAPRQDAPAPGYAVRGRDRFATFEPNTVTPTDGQPVSTFSIDVDTASYAFVRRALQGGSLPRPDAVRIEEMVNYFPYDYEAPTEPGQPFAADVSVFPTPWNEGTRLMRIGIQGFAPAEEARPPVNLVFLIDSSGSMDAPDKLPLLKASFRLLLDRLGAEDTVSIVTYAGATRTVLEPTAATERGAILDALENLRAGGGTAGAAGLELAYEAAAKGARDGTVSRVILATDGDFNIGAASPDAMKDFIADKRGEGVFLSVLGFGQGNLNDALMQSLAQNGNGQAAYIDTLAEARKVLVEEAGGALIPIAKDVKIQVEFNPAQVAEYRLIGYETRALNREDFNDDKVDAGEIGAGHQVTALYEIVPAGSDARLTDPLRYGAEAEALAVSDEASDELAFVKIRWKRPDADESTLVTRPVTETDATDDPGTEARFAAAVAGFGQLLQGGRYTGDFDYDAAAELARGAKGEDPYGYRAEAVRLMELAASLAE